MTSELLGIIGTLLLLGLTVNGFFIKSLVDAINSNSEKTSTVATSVAVLVNDMIHVKARVENSETRIEQLDESDKLIRDGVHEMRTTLGNRIQVLEFQQKRIKPT